MTPGTRLFASAAALAALPFAALADDAKTSPSLPDDYASSYVNYYSNDRMSVDGQAIRAFANKEAMSSAKDGGEPAYGSKLVGELWSVKTDKDGAPQISILGRKIRDSLVGLVVMERIKGADDAYNDNMKVGDWAFAVYNADGSKKGDGDVSACRTCHEPLGERHYLWSYEHLAKKVVE